MRSKLILGSIAVLGAVTMFSCKQQETTTPQANTSSMRSTSSSGEADQHAISIPDANACISSYRQSYGDSCVYSVAVDTAVVKELLNEGRSKYITVYFAHTPAWTAHSPGQKNANEFTVILGGYDHEGNLITRLMEHFCPCPLVEDCCPKKTTGGLIPINR